MPPVSKEGCKPVVLVTRPREWGGELNQKLCALGYGVFHEPLLTIRYLDPPQPSAQLPDCVLLTSRTAVRAIQHKKSKFDAFFPLPCFCVGDHTAEAARSVGFCHIVSSQPTGQRLAEDMLKHVGEGSTVLHICGAIRSPEPQALLGQKGIKVEALIVYEAEESERLSDGVIAAIQASAIDVVLLFSPHTAQVWEKLIRQHNLEPCCHRLLTLGLSESVNNCLNTDQYAMVSVASSPTQDALIARLCAEVPLVTKV